MPAMVMAYCAAQVIVPLAVQGIPMVAVHARWLPPLLIEGIVLASGIAGFFTTFHQRTD